MKKLWISSKSFFFPLLFCQFVWCYQMKQASSAKRSLYNFPNEEKKIPVKAQDEFETPETIQTGQA